MVGRWPYARRRYVHWLPRIACGFDAGLSHDTTKQRSDRLKAARVAARPPKVPATVTRRLVAALNDPASGKEPVYTRLLVNHDEVLKARTRWDGLRWDAIARVMVEDGILGSRGEPPNANSVRRV